jgi:NitT/TauT family transport system permease protein
MADADVDHDTAAETDLAQQLEGLDRLELSLPARPSRGRRAWQASWPIVAAILIGLLLWQIVVWSGWKPKYLLPGPVPAFKALWDARHDIFPGALTTFERAIEFYLISLVVGTAIALLVTRSRNLRTAVTPLVSGLQTMPNVAWVPFAIVIFGTGTIRPIAFVALMGTIPSFVIGTVSAIDTVPPVLHRAGQILGTKGFTHQRYVVLPAALPGYVAGMRQAWAFLWRALMAGELIAPVAGTKALGQLLSSYQDASDYSDVVATMLMILVIGLLADAVVFSRLERVVLARRGITTVKA